MLYLGDCSEILKTFSDEQFHIVLTSPPYNRKRNDKYANFNDFRPDWFEWQKTILHELLRVTSNWVFYNVQATFYNRADVYKLIGEFSPHIKDIFIWEKTNPIPSNGGKSITNSVEYILVLGKKPLRANSIYVKNIISTSVNSKMPKNHKAVMKQEVADWIISEFTKEGEKVLDPFMGLGTTGLSCKTYEGREFFGIEINEDYFNEAKRRLEEK